jgi:MoaA/NifB/PqqE/SkfB family radical SAM enzyme
MRPLRLALSIVSNQLGLVPRPSWCTYLVCYRCNARCKMCDSWRMKPGDELTPDEVRIVFGKIGRLDVVRLTGGEPFLREDFNAVALGVWETARPSVLHITSNGSFPDRVVDFVEHFPQPKYLRFMISFDGLEEEHDVNRGDDVTFATAFDTVQRLAERRRRLGLQVSVNHTIISPRSLDDHEELCRRFRALDVDVQAVLAYSDSAMYGLKRNGKKAQDLITRTGYPLHPKLEGCDVIGFVKRELRGLRHLRDPLLRIGKRYYLRGLLARLQNRPRPRPHPKCVALRSHIRLLPDGSVPVCQFNTEKIGNLLTQSFEEVWHGASAGSSRAWVDGCEGCWAECEVMPSALYSGDLFVQSILG